MLASGGLASTYHVLSRRVASLSNELDVWIEKAANDHSLARNYSQIESLDYFMRSLCALSQEKLKCLDSTHDVDAFLGQAFELTRDVIKSHIVWDFFRNRLMPRFVPHFKKPLHVTDLIAYDCYVAVMTRAKRLQIIPKQGFREYPLIGLFTQSSPATWPRGRRPPALQNHVLPVPVIDLPWNHLITPWELLTIAHEVGHDVDQDLGQLARELQPILVEELQQMNVPIDRQDRWEKWTGEILADLIGILLTGPAFVNMLIRFLTLPKDDIVNGRFYPKHPPHYLRVLINTAVLHKLGASQTAQTLTDRWKTLYDTPQKEIASYVPDMDVVIPVILDARLNSLDDQNGQPHSVSELFDFTPDDQALIQETAFELADNVPPSEKLPLRHLVSASQLAFEQVVATQVPLDLEKLAHHTQQVIIDRSPSHKLDDGTLASSRTRQHLESLALEILEYDLKDFDALRTRENG